MNTEQKRKDGRGGKREGAGRHSQYGSPTATLCFRVPQTHREAIKTMVRNYLESIKVAKKRKIEPEYGC